MKIHSYKYKIFFYDKVYNANGFFFAHNCESSCNMPGPVQSR